MAALGPAFAAASIGSPVLATEIDRNALTDALDDEYRAESTRLVMENLGKNWNCMRGFDASSKRQF